ncbi:phosphatidylserine decarboxylase, putative [Leishmania donovani]|uniref:phosphatidylserine decarboxylase n=1 Tax=Leishmania donovani TaxID=5661 RepID=A0A3S7X9Y9_LEIDO|nr:phosphatidylserine decarboxylase, putative [Leishmania donovani]AYU83266.1 phosphatidylserine decarboxylase, putative [Leishmania donovani]TPP44716.1 Phosphatidylserine decarboxylase family protein [Leishmania donovani]CBZ38364.1 phosphatidylserine decarboxylase, putative [Leishmania donovani]
MELFRITAPLRFYKSNRGIRLSNPSRRWLYNRLFLGGIGAFGCYLTLRYQLAAWEASRNPEDGNCLCSSDMVDFLRYMPFNLFSNVVGRLVENESVPAWVHNWFAQAVVYWYALDMSESLQKTNFETFQQFYVRDWTPKARPVDAAASVVAPCDGQVLAVNTNVESTSLVQVKGLTYGMRSLLQETPPPLGTDTHRRVAVVLHMRNKDFHHVIAPLSFACEKSIYVPGSLLPTTAAGYHWIPAVLTLNERLVLQGRSSDKARLPVYMALVGSTLTGRITLYMDKRVRTNYLDPPAYAVHSPYASKPVVARGERLATFNWGSSVVLVMDVPKSCKPLKRAGDVVKAGEALFQF